MPDSARIHFGRTFCAPGRVNLIGEHTDYNGGFAMPAAIGFVTRVRMSPRNDRRVVSRSENFGEAVEFDLAAMPQAPRGNWNDYVLGVAAQLEAAGYELKGADLTIHSTIPAGAGLSSSAALEVSTALAMMARSEIAVDRRELALLCQRAENDFVGVRCGIMDQLTSCLGRKGHALLLDCRTLDVSYVPVPREVRLVVCNSMVKHALTSGEYNRRREQCEEGVRRLAQFLPMIRQLRDVTLVQLDALREELDPLIFRRCRHVIGENLRTVKAADALRNRELKTFGLLMNASHESLRDDYEVSCEELDILVDLAQSQAGVHGSRMTGGGFGGCTISLVDESRVEAFVMRVADGYARRTGIQCETYVFEAAEGAREEVPGERE